MKIVHTEASCGWGGQEIRIIEESLGMMARGHEVVILCPQEARIYQEAPKRGVSVEALPIGRKKIRGMLALRAWLKAHRVDVLNTHSSTDSWLAALACATLREAPPLVRTRHISAPISSNAPTRWLYTAATRHIVTTGEALRQELIRVNGFPAESITSVPTGIDPQRFTQGDKVVARQNLGLGAEGRYIGIIATLRSWKGHLFLIEAFAKLHEPDLKLLIVGDGPMREALEQKACELGLQERVIFAGQRPDPENWLQALDIFCLPSYANEGVPQAILQAMLSELPIVTTPVGAILEAVQHDQSALIVQPKDSGAIADAIKRLLADSALAKRLACQARIAACEKFSRDSMLDRMEAVFKAAITAPSHRR